MSHNNVFIHHVYFWLKNPGNENDRNDLIKGLQALSKIENCTLFHIGVPANTEREVVDNSYGVSWMLFFDNKEEQEKYQVAPLHLKFVEDCKHLWSRVVVYDTLPV